MTKLENKQGIMRITMMPTAYTKCVIGQDWYKNKLEILFEPNGCYPDYMEVNNWIMTEVDGKALNIEDVVDVIYNFLRETYQPKSLKIIDHIVGCKTHFDVIVEKF